MKTLNISREEFRDAVERLWDSFADDPTANFSLCPFQSNIGVYRSGTEEAIINVVDIVDGYDLVSTIKEN